MTEKEKMRSSVVLIAEVVETTSVNPERMSPVNRYCSSAQIHNLDCVIIQTFRKSPLSNRAKSEE
jgi:hypothetical protein